MRRTMAHFAKRLMLVGFSAAMLACSMGDELVSGIGNGGNRFYATPVIDELAEVLASNAVVVPVTDEMLRTAFDAIAGRAAEGDPDAALILFRVAEAQRKADAE